MLRTGWRQVLGTAAIAAFLVMTMGGVSLAGADCTLSVSPKSGPPGTEFTFSGSGYTPTELRLTRDGAEPKIVPLSLAGADPFDFSIVAGEGDVGRWKAVAWQDDTCHGEATIRVTLPSTSTLADPAAPDRTPLLASLLGLGAVFVTTTTLLVRRSRRTA
ncbi:MAG: hypothetical protein QOH61_889 [Chloroflexota bacterium]|jgi:hypothetical protein|nr:hypothetical protein [Chloroflexota bacterium]